MTEATIRNKPGMASVKDMPVLQDGPPPGWFAPVRFARRIPNKGPLPSPSSLLPSALSLGACIRSASATRSEVFIVVYSTVQVFIVDKEINKELSRKLEIQTQRLELLTAQSMVNENISTKQPDSRAMYENTQYADEGDEVVERVLGWLMKLFPGGPSRRRTSKLL
ncbi:unnamed protein product [Sphenostylis stenocarpa]|uniref:Uncharacterized protein n=1 Tax=Sphenostylis stenocarpa TaxID=92480 RepID=A0AA86VTI4_9FABA|nr:unnamed protein product [Sphenostylis stenocarpa]